MHHHCIAGNSEVDNITFINAGTVAEFVDERIQRVLNHQLLQGFKFSFRIAEGNTGNHIVCLEDLLIVLAIISFIFLYLSFLPFYIRFKRLRILLEMS